MLHTKAVGKTLLSKPGLGESV